MQPDTEKYRAFLRPLGLAKDHEDEIIAFAWGIMRECVASAFNQHPVQVARTQKIINTWPRTINIPRQILSNVVDINHPQMKETFCAAAGVETQENNP